MFILSCWVSNNIITNVEHTDNVMSDICLNNAVLALRMSTHKRTSHSSLEHKLKGKPTQVKNSPVQ